MQHLVPCPILVDAAGIEPAQHAASDLQSDGLTTLPDTSFWRRVKESNPHDSSPRSGFQDRRVYQFWFHHWTPGGPRRIRTAIGWATSNRLTIRPSPRLYRFLFSSSSPASSRYTHNITFLVFLGLHDERVRVGRQPVNRGDHGACCAVFSPRHPAIQKSGVSNEIPTMVAEPGIEPGLVGYEPT